MVDSKAGKIPDALKESGGKDNTIVIFTSDNRSSPWAGFPALNALGHDPNYIFRCYNAVNLSRSPVCTVFLSCNLPGKFVYL